jgi:hypothetical protein
VSAANCHGFTLVEKVPTTRQLLREVAQKKNTTMQLHKVLGKLPYYPSKYSLVLVKNLQHNSSSIGMAM